MDASLDHFGGSGPGPIGLVAIAALRQGGLFQEYGWSNWLPFTKYYIFVRRYEGEGKERRVVEGFELRRAMRQTHYLFPQSTPVQVPRSFRRLKKALAYLQELYPRPFEAVIVDHYGFEVRFERKLF